MKKSGKMSDGIDKIDDKYLLEALEYKAPSGRRGTLKLLAAAVASLFLLLGGVFLWERLGPSETLTPEQEIVQEEQPVETVETWYIDSHTFLAGKGSEGSIQLKAGEMPEEQPAPQVETKKKIVLHWWYQSVGVEGIWGTTQNELNRKLAEDGYPFSVQFDRVYVVNKTDPKEWHYQQFLHEGEGADIAFSGFYPSGDHAVLDSIEQGLYEPLDEYLKYSDYYDQIPEVLWQSVTYQDHVYFFPNEIAQDAGLTLYLRKDSFTKEEADAFDGDLFSLKKYFQEGKRFLDAASPYAFAEAFGYSYYNGVLLTADGKAVTPLEEENCVGWLKLLNDYSDQVTSRSASSWDFALSRSFPGTGNGKGNREEDFYTYAWKGYVVPRYNCQTGILASSKHKEEAFELLDLIRTDRSYAELLLFGKAAVDGVSKKQCSYERQLVFGLDTGLVLREQGDLLRYFSTEEEKKSYYEKNILPSPALSLKNPQACDAMLPVEDFYKKLIHAEDFETLLKQARKELKEPMRKVKKAIW